MSLRHAILGFLSLRPQTGYELKNVFANSVSHFWSADQAQIYRMLSELVDKGLASVERIAQADRPDRKVHHITSAGRVALDTWLQTPSSPPIPREPFLVKLFFMSRLDTDQVKGLVTHELKLANEALDGLRPIVEGFHPTTPRSPAPDSYLGPVITLFCGATQLRAHRDALMSILKLLDSDFDMKPLWEQIHQLFAANISQSPPEPDND